MSPRAAPASTRTPSRISTSAVVHLVLQRGLPPILAALLFLVFWQFAVSFWKIKPFLVPPPGAVLQSLFEDRARLANAWWLTGKAAITGLALSFVVGSAVGMLFAQFQWLRFAFYPYAIFLQTVPIVAIAPVLVLWLGYGARGVIAVAFVLSLFPIIANMTAGLLSVPVPLHELFQLNRATRWQRLQKLQLPFAIPYLATGLKTSSGLSVIGAIVGEFFVGYGGKGFGLGYLIRTSAEGYQTPTLFATVILSTLLGVAVFAVVGGLAELILRRWGL